MVKIGGAGQSASSPIKYSSRRSRKTIIAVSKDHHMQSMLPWRQVWANVELINNKSSH